MGFLARSASQARAPPLRRGLEASRPFRLEGDTAPKASAEVGVRIDGSDEETGSCVDVGDVIAWSGPDQGISTSLRGRGFLFHEIGGFRYRGFSAFLPTTAEHRGKTAIQRASAWRRTSATACWRLGGGHIWTPEAEIGLSNTERDYGIGWRLATGKNGIGNIVLVKQRERRKAAT